MMKETLNIQGMTCNHCVMAVRKELAKLHGLEVDDVRIGSAVVKYDASIVSQADIEHAIITAGFSLLAAGQTSGGFTQIQT